MRKVIPFLAAILLALQAQGKVVVTTTKCDLGDISTDMIVMAQKGGKMQVEIEFNLSNLEVPSNLAVLITPYIVSGANQVELPSVGIYGRRRYYYYLRNNGEQMLTGATETVIRAKKRGDRLTYKHSLKWEEWMKNCEMGISRKVYGCCNEKIQEDYACLARSEEHIFRPVFRYVQPIAVGAKQHSLSGSALITFPVNQTVIKPDYKDNEAELEKIASTIRGVSSDEDYTIDAITLKGFASPEGSYVSNARLAEGRTDALKYYIVAHYGIPERLIHTSFEPENWEGLREYVASSILPFKDEILEVIDSDIFSDLDKKEWRIKSKYPKDYATLLSECYPLLRRTDYEVDYTIRSYTDVDEIRSLVKTAPGKLSLEEFYLAAMGLERGSEEFNEIFDVAVRMYPDDPAANINAANAAMSRGDMVQAERFLEKAGDSPDADYAREVFAALSGDEAAAERLEARYGP